MEAHGLMTLDDLMQSPEERVELIDGEIVRRPMARAEHGLAQSRTPIELSGYDRISGPQGWWILTEIGVAYGPHQCPAHDLAGWRRERMPHRPTGVVELAPDWVCEIVSPGHERKDTLKLFLLLQRQRVPFYWILWPEDRVLIAYRLEAGQYRVIATVEGAGRARIPPFEEADIDLGYIDAGNPSKRWPKPIPSTNTLLSHTLSSPRGNRPGPAFASIFPIGPRVRPSRRGCSPSMPSRSCSASGSMRRGQIGRSPRWIG